MSIELENLSDVLNAIEELADVADIEKAITKSCLLVETSATQKAKKGRTGELAQSIQSEVKGLRGEVFTPLEYAPYVEFGTGLFAENGGRSAVPWVYCDDKGDFYTTYGQHPQPFMRPALDENRAEIIRIIKEGATKK